MAKMTTTVYEADDKKAGMTYDELCEVFGSPDRFTRRVKVKFALGWSGQCQSVTFTEPEPAPPCGECGFVEDSDDILTAALRELARAARLTLLTATRDVDHSQAAVLAPVRPRQDGTQGGA